MSDGLKPSAPCGGPEMATDGAGQPAELDTVSTFHSGPRYGNKPTFDFGPERK